MPCWNLRAALAACALACVSCSKPEYPATTAVFPVLGSLDETEARDDHTIVPPGRLGSRGTRQAILAWWAPMLGVVALAMAAERLLRRRARSERAQFTGSLPAGGPAAIDGVVESDGDAIVVEITQRRSSYRDKQGREHVEWHEKSRRVQARPFRVVRADGTVFNVEPDDRVLLRDQVEAPEHIDTETRRRRVRLQGGERVWVAGLIAGSASKEGTYRDGISTATLRPGRFHRMVISTDPPGDFFSSRAEYHRGWRQGVLVALAVVQLSLLGDCTLQAILGRPEALTITHVKTWKEWVKPKNQSGYWKNHFAAGDLRGTGEAGMLEVSETLYRCALQGACHTLPTHALPGGLLRTVGRGPTLHGVQAGLACVGGWITAIVYLVMARRSRPWHAGGKVNG